MYEQYLATLKETNQILFEASMIQSIMGSDHSPLDFSENIIEDFKTTEKTIHMIRFNLTQKSPSYEAARLYSKSLKYGFLFDYSYEEDIWEHGYTVQVLQKCSDEENNITGTYELPTDQYFSCRESATESTALANVRRCLDPPQSETNMNFYCRPPGLLYQAINDTLFSIFDESKLYEEKIRKIYGNTTEYSSILQMVDYQECVAHLVEANEPWEIMLSNLIIYYGDYLNATTWTQKLSIALKVEDASKIITDILLNYTLFDECNWYYHDFQYFMEDKAWNSYQDYSGLAKGSLTNAQNTKHLRESGLEAYAFVGEALAILVDPHISYLNASLSKTFLHQYVNSKQFQETYDQLKLKHSSFESNLKSFANKLVEIENYLQQSYHFASNMTLPVMTYDIISQFKFVRKLSSEYTDVNNSAISELLASLSSGVESALIGLVENTFGTYRRAVKAKTDNLNGAQIDLQNALSLAKDELETFHKANAVDEDFFMYVSCNA